MAIIKSVRGFTPKFGDNCFFADNAVVIGEVTMGNNCTVWFNAVVRGDVHSITIGDNSNIQDGAVVHCTYQKAKTIIGSNVSVAHNAIVHGTIVEPGSMYAGNPAKRMKDISDEMREVIQRTARNYPMYAEWFK
jgi:gamma-carbonic anhydrase